MFFIFLVLFCVRTIWHFQFDVFSNNSLNVRYKCLPTLHNFSDLKDAWLDFWIVAMAQLIFGKGIDRDL